MRRKGAVVADHELERIMAQVDLDGNHTLDFQVRGASNTGDRACAAAVAAVVNRIHAMCLDCWAASSCTANCCLCGQCCCCRSS
jgi:hypothetical protein